MHGNEESVDFTVVLTVFPGLHLQDLDDRGRVADLHLLISAVLNFDLIHQKAESIKLGSFQGYAAKSDAIFALAHTCQLCRVS